MAVLSVFGCPAPPCDADPSTARAIFQGPRAAAAPSSGLIWRKRRRDRSSDGLMKSSISFNPPRLDSPGSPIVDGDKIRQTEDAMRPNLAVAILAVSLSANSSGQEGGEAPVYGVKLPSGYREWKMISVAYVGGPLNDSRVKFGNEVASGAYRDNKRPFPDGTIIARLAYQQVASEINNKVFRAAAEQQGVPPEQIEKLLSASAVAGPPTNVQFMIKDSKKYAATGGWGFAQFTNGKPDGAALHKTCFACHAPAKDRDFVFTDFAP